MHRKLRLDRKAFLNRSKHAITIRHLKLAGIYERVKRRITSYKTQKGTVIKLDGISKDFFYLLGLIASDGNNTKEKKTVRFTRIKFHNRNKKLIEAFLKTYKKIFPNIPIKKKGFKDNLIELDTSNSFLATVAASLGIKSPQKNSDLLSILNANPELIKAFLKGYFDGDGSVYYKKYSYGYKTKINFHTVNHNTAVKLHKMLLKVNILNRILHRNAFINKKNHNMYDISIGNISEEKKFIKEIGTNHPFKLKRFKKILAMPSNSKVYSHCYIGLHYKEEIRKNRNKLYNLGGNLYRVLNMRSPITKGFYEKSSSIIGLPPLDEFMIEKISSIRFVNGADYVYDLTIPKTHNFLIETGFVSSNCHDIGKELKVGAHMQQLIRTKAGPFNDKEMISLHDLKDAYEFYKEGSLLGKALGKEEEIRKCVKPFENAVEHLPKIWVFDGAVDPLCHGSDLYVPGISKLNDKIEKNDTVAVLTLKHELVSIGVAEMDSNQILKEKKGVAVRAGKVFMERGTYGNK